MVLLPMAQHGYLMAIPVGACVKVAHGATRQSYVALQVGNGIGKAIATMTSAFA
jgi:hypothetical protein